MGDGKGVQTSVLGRIQSCTGRESTREDVHDRRETKFRCKLGKIGNLIEGSRTSPPNWLVNVI